MISELDVLVCKKKIDAYDAVKKGKTEKLKPNQRQFEDYFLLQWNIDYLFL